MLSQLSCHLKDKKKNREVPICFWECYHSSFLSCSKSQLVLFSIILTAHNQRGSCFLLFSSKPQVTAMAELEFNIIIRTVLIEWFNSLKFCLNQARCMILLEQKDFNAVQHSWTLLHDLQLNYTRIMILYKIGLMQFNMSELFWTPLKLRLSLNGEESCFELCKTACFF